MREALAAEQDAMHVAHGIAEAAAAAALQLAGLRTVTPPPFSAVAFAGYFDVKFALQLGSINCAFIFFFV